ncbi:MAG: hypothetical protein QOI55_1537, partial [Actinomycetota bacterium]|nr:hypothetical protein [Actinomycetota bacterium]
MTGRAPQPDRTGAPAYRWVAQVALIVSATATGLVIAIDHRLPNGWHNTVVAVACVAYVVMIVAEQRWGGLTIALVATALIASTVVALSVPPRFTGDLWAYAASGRTLAVHHVNPWTHSPADFPHDPIFRLVAGPWAHTPSVSGPLFTGISALGATVVGTAALPIRLFYQGLAAIALGSAGLLVWSRTRSAAAVAFLTVHPVAFMYLVNGGRNDIYVGLAMLGAVILLARDRPGTAGVVAGLGALVKITGTVGLVALLVTTIARGSPRAARRLASGIVAVVGVGFLAAGWSAVSAPLKSAGSLYS